MDFELLWGRATRVLTFFAGIAIMGYETVFDAHDRPWVIAGAIGMMGVPLARAAENLLSRFATTQEPLEQPPARGRPAKTGLPAKKPRAKR